MTMMYVSDEEVTPMHPKQKSTKSASGDGDVPLVKKPLMSKVMNKKERDGLKLQFLLTHQISLSYIPDKFKVEKTLSEKFKQLASSLLGKDVSDWAYLWWILVIVVLMI